MTEATGRVSVHGVRRELVARQACAAGVALAEVAIERDGFVFCDLVLPRPGPD